MGLAVVEGATLRCSLGTDDSILVGATGRFAINGSIVATIADHLPVNLGGFLICKSDQQLCVPITPAPWAGACSSINTGGVQLLSSSAKLNCVRCGTISIIDAGQSVMATESLEPQKTDDDGWVPSIVHSALELAANIPGPPGTAATSLDAWAYGLEGNREMAQAKNRAMLGGLLPIPKPVTKLGGKAIRKVFPDPKPKSDPLDFGDALHSRSQRQQLEAVVKENRKRRARDAQQAHQERSEDSAEYLGSQAAGKILEASPEAEPLLGKQIEPPGIFDDKKGDS
jgi:hypothetical protein